MEQFKEAQELVSAILAVEHAKKEALLVRAWASTASLAIAALRSPIEDADFADELQTVKSCLSLLAGHGLPEQTAHLELPTEAKSAFNHMRKQSMETASTACDSSGEGFSSDLESPIP